MSRKEAKRRAYGKLGNPQQMRENLWRQNTVVLLDSLWRDLRYATRTLTRSPGFTIIAVLVMGLGTGANIALFTEVRSVLLNPLPFRDSGQLYAIYESETKTTNLNKYFPVEAGSLAEWQRSTQKIAQIALVSPWQSYNVSAEAASCRKNRRGVVRMEFLRDTRCDASAGALLHLGRRSFRCGSHGDPVLVVLEAPSMIAIRRSSAKKYFSMPGRRP
jgi:hypothetical protein